MTYLAQFATGQQSAITVRGRCPDFNVGLATRDDGYRRCVFFTDDGAMQQPDAWVSGVVADERRV